MNITKEQIKEWLSKNYPSIIGSVRMAIGEKKSFDEVIHDCIQDLCPKWVSVEDELPKHNVCVDVWASVIGGYSHGDEFRCENVFYDRENDYWWMHDQEEGCERVILNFLSITHWMPLPEPPK